jgi:integrase
VASIVNDPNGRRRILFVAPDGSRKTIRLGKCDRKSAEGICRHVEALLAAKIGGQPLPRDTAAWLTTVGGKLRDKLAAVGLVEPERRLTVGEYLEEWLSHKASAGHSAASAVVWRQAIRDINELFRDRPLASLVHADGEALRNALLARELRPTTIHKRLTLARQFLEDAVRLGHIQANPWKHVRHRAGDPAERRAYVPVTDAGRVIEHCPNVWWKLLVALGRFGGLRIPSEAFSLTWGDVDWERGRLTVPSPKTRCHGKPHRVIPLFPLLRPHLEAAFEHAEEGSEYVFPEEYRERANGPNGWINANLRTQFERVIRRAGVEPWPRLWHSLRASCESDLAQSFPLATVTKWMGNTPSVALKHYVDPTEAAFESARTWTPPSGAKSGAPEAQNPAQQTTAGSRGEQNLSPENADGEAGSASPCDTPRDNAHSSSGAEEIRTLDLCSAIA